MVMNGAEKGKAVVLWTGGKDCVLALHLAERQGYHIQKLVTFVPTASQFKAHGLKLMAYQAQALEIPHQLIPVTEPYLESYQQGMQQLQQEGIQTLITGDIGEVDGYPNWVRECAEPLGLEVATPLWGMEPLELLHGYVDADLKVVFSCVKSPWLTMDWLGRVLDEQVLEDLQEQHRETGIDLCGEQGEYHTVVLDGPLFKREITLRSVQRCQEGELMYLKIEELDLEGKAGGKLNGQS